MIRDVVTAAPDLSIKRLIADYFLRYGYRGFPVTTNGKVSGMISLANVKDFSEQGLLNIVPYLSVVGWPIVIFLKYAETLTSGAGQTADFLSIALWPSVVYVGVQLLEGWLLTPWIQSGQTNPNAATVLVVVIIGGALGGILGLLFAIPIAACIKILLQEVILPQMRRWAGDTSGC
ncbi:MAG: AI-2E family transporter [Candidatus Binatia bacterium]